MPKRKDWANPALHRATRSSYSCYASPADQTIPRRVDRSVSEPTNSAELPALELTTFGAPVVRVAGGDPPAEVEWRKNLALLAYLAVSADRTRSRAQIIGLLWPEATEQRARHSLNEAVHQSFKKIL